MEVQHRYAVKIYYDGRGFHGFQLQKDERTVGGEILSALHRSGLLEGVASPSFQAASRTDRGVSALGQTVAFNSLKAFSTMRLNAFLPDSIMAWAWAEVPFSFNPRREATGRVYVYIHPWHGESVGRMREAAGLLVEKYVSGFYRGRGGIVFQKRLKRIAVSLRGQHVFMRFYARSFERGSVRRLASVILKAGRLEFEVDWLAEMMMKPEAFRKVVLASPENLILLDVKYGFKFNVDEASRRRLMSAMASEVCVCELKKLSLKILEKKTGIVV